MTSLQKRPERTLPLHELSLAPAHPVATVAANLMPPEVTARRRLGWLKRRLAFALVAMVVLVGLGYTFARQQTSSTEDQLAAEQQRGSGFQQRISSYDDVVRIQGQAAGIRTQLASVMGNDLAWSRLLTALNAAAPGGLVVNQVDGEVTDPNATAGSDDTGAFNPSGQQLVGTLSVSGTAKDYRSVAAYVDALSRTKGFAMVDPGSVTTDAGRTAFTISLSLTKAVLGGRFTGGK